jgi:tetratricopeptide (TPR) repeat protein
LWLLESSQYNEAKAALSRSIELKPSTTAYVYLCVACCNTQQFEAAEQYCREAISMDVGFDEAHYNLGKIYQMQNRFDEAICAFHEAIRLSPNYQLAHLNLGSIYIQTGDITKARQHLLKSLELNPLDDRASKYLAEIEEVD